MYICMDRRDVIVRNPRSVVQKEEEPKQQQQKIKSKRKTRRSSSTVVNKNIFIWKVGMLYSHEKERYWWKTGRLKEGGRERETRGYKMRVHSHFQSPWRFTQKCSGSLLFKCCLYVHGLVVYILMGSRGSDHHLQCARLSLSIFERVECKKKEIYMLYTYF